MVLISNKCQSIDFDEAIIYNAALTTLNAHGSVGCEVSILLTDDAEIQVLNCQYRYIDAPTDVLAFAMREGVGGDLNPQLLGDLVISVPTAQRQSIAHGHSLDIELAILSVHGTLHLLGYDHQTPEQAEITFGKQAELFRLIST